MTQWIRYPIYGMGIISVATFSALPVGPPNGVWYYTVDTRILYVYENGSWISIGGDVAPTTNVSFRATKEANQTIPHGADTKITFPTEVFDNGGYYNTATSRFTPLVAGLYAFNLAFTFDSPSAGNVDAQAIIYANTSTYLARVAYSIVQNTLVSCQAQAIIELNGTTDYVEPFCVFVGNGGGTLDIFGVASFNQWQGHLIFRT